MKQINKHKHQGGGKSTLKSQSAYSMTGGSAGGGGGGGGTTKSNKSLSSNSSSSNQNYLNILVADPNTYKWLMQRKIEISTKNKALKLQECFTPAENTLLQLMNNNTNNQQKRQSDTIQSVDTIRSNQSVGTLSRNGILVNGGGNRGADVPRNLIMKRCIVRKLRVRHF